MASSELQRRVRDLVEPTVRGMGYDLVAVEQVTGPHRPVLRLSIDATGGVGADDCAKVSVRLGPLLDAEDPMPTAYDLEVSSPGIERPLQRLEDFVRFAGFKARVRLEPGPARRRYTGRLVGISDGMVEITVDGENHLLDFDQIEVARLVLTLEEYERLAHSPASEEAPTPTDDGVEDP